MKPFSRPLHNLVPSVAQASYPHQLNNALDSLIANEHSLASLMLGRLNSVEKPVKMPFEPLR